VYQNLIVGTSTHHHHTPKENMTTIVIVGAGRGVGTAVAQRFGRERFAVALISRNQSHLDTLAADLTADGITAQGFAADVRDTAALEHAIDTAAATLGPIEVMQYSPIPHRDFLKPVLETTKADLAGAVDFSVFGPFAAARRVLDQMRSVGTGTMVFINGGSAVRPNPGVAGTSIAFAAESAYAQILHDTLAAENIHVAQLIIPGAIRPDSPDTSPAIIADRIWNLHQQRDGFRHFLTAMEPPATG
jgi:NAD(P)-dependent dehydrogenase (short-subunit alcohol dehydrogenase family)